MDVEEFRKAGYAAIDAICDYHQSLSSRPVKAEVQPGYLLEQLPSEAPERGEPFSQISTDFQQHVLPGITHWQSPKFFAYFPANSTFEGMLGDLYAASVSNPGFNWICSPACTELEQVVMDWVAKLLGLSSHFWTSSKRGGGIILGSASESALTAGMAARERALRVLSKGVVPDGEVASSVREQYGQKLVMYGSTQTHSLGAKAAIMLGLQFRALPVSAKDGYALRGDALRKAMEEDVAAGLVPFFIIATVGTTSSGAVDRIAEIGQVLKEYPTAFLHIDAAWAGVAFALPEYRGSLRLDEVNQYADSFCTNLHKWGLTTFDCSTFFVRDRRDLTEMFDVTPPFLRSKEADAGAVIDYRNWQIALGRRFRSLKIWFVLRSYGVEGFRRHLERGIEHCKRLAEIVRQSTSFELVTEPSLALLVFRLAPTSSANDKAKVSPTPDILNVLNQRLRDHLNARSDVFVTQTVLHSLETNIFCIRFAMGGVNTSFDDVKSTWEIIEAEGVKVLEAWDNDPVAIS